MPYWAYCNNKNIININIVLKNILALNKRIYTENKCNFPQRQSKINV